jgi:hypothetical protein
VTRFDWRYKTENFFRSKSQVVKEIIETLGLEKTYRADALPLFPDARPFLMGFICALPFLVDFIGAFC